MKRNSILVAIWLLLMGGAVSAQNDSVKADDEKAIRANLEQMVKGWNVKSGEEFAKPFAEDSDYVVVNGMHIKGRAANAKGHQQIFDTIYKDTEISGIVEQIRFLRPDIALIHAVTERFPKTDRNHVTKGRLTMVMVKTDDEWEIVAFQNTQIQNAPQR